MYNTGDGVATKSEGVDDSAAEATTGDVDRAADSETTGEDVVSVEQQPYAAATEVENEKEVQQAASGWWNGDFNNLNSIIVIFTATSHLLTSSCTITTGSPDVVSAEKMNKSARLAALREGGLREGGLREGGSRGGGEFLSGGNDRHGGHNQPPSTNAFSKRFSQDVR